MKTQPHKISLFFGAGAEIAYGIPDGGRFTNGTLTVKQ